LVSHCFHVIVQTMHYRLRWITDNINHDATKVLIMQNTEIEKCVTKLYKLVVLLDNGLDVMLHCTLC